MARTAYLVFENGQAFEGLGFGAEGTATGEAVFTTSVVGTTQAVSDAAHHGKILISSFPFAGNYGVIPEEMESGGAHVKAYIVREWCRQPSNFRSEGELDAFFKRGGVVGLEAIDTRRVVKLLRDSGPMNATVTPDKDAALKSLDALRAYKSTGDVAAVSPKERSELGDPEGKTVALLDLGASNSFKRELASRGLRVVVLPHDAAASEIAAMRPDGVIISNGPGAPGDNHGIQREIAALCRLGVPVLAVGLGHLRLALALGGKVTRMKRGHHGTNQPVRDAQSGRIFIAGQSHEYEADVASLPAGARVRYVSVNDGSVEGLDYPGADIISAQFVPGAPGGVADSCFVYDRFIKRMGGAGRAAE